MKTSRRNNSTLIIALMILLYAVLSYTTEYPTTEIKPELYSSVMLMNGHYERVNYQKLVDPSELGENLNNEVDYIMFYLPNCNRDRAIELLAKHEWREVVELIVKEDK